MNENNETIVTDWSAPVMVGMTLKDLFKIRLALGQLNYTATEKALEQCFDFGSLPKEIKKKDFNKLYKMLIDETQDLSLVINKFNSLFAENTYKESVTKQYCVSYKFNDSPYTAYYLDVDEALKTYREVIYLQDRGKISDLKLETKDITTKVPLTKITNLK